MVERLQGYRAGSARDRTPPVYGSARVWGENVHPILVLASSPRRVFEGSQRPPMREPSNLEVKAEEGQVEYSSRRDRHSCETSVDYEDSAACFRE